MPIRIKQHKVKGGRVKAHKRRKKGGGTIMVKSATRKASTIKAHKQAASGKGKKKRNSVGKMVYKGNK